MVHFRVKLPTYFSMLCPNKNIATMPHDCMAWLVKKKRGI